MAIINQTDKVICTQDNQVIESCYTMPLVEKRLLLLAISKIDPTRFPEAHIPLVVPVNVSEWRKIYDLQNPWRDIKGASKSLMARHVTFHPRTGLTKRVNWFASVEYFDDKGYMVMEFTRPMQIRLAGMLEQFTKVDLLSVSKLKSVHSIRLYELLSQFDSTGYRVMTLEDFRFAMGCVDSYKVTAELIKFVVKPAIKQINAKTNYTVSYDNIKAGRRITGFKFFFKEDKQVNMEL